MKTHVPTKLITLLLVCSFLTNFAFAANEPVPSGSFIVNMGVVPQTYANGIKPWGMVYDLIKNHKVPIKWIINPAKAKDGADFSYNGTDYKGGTFIILKSDRNSAVDARITYWQSQGVVGVTTTSDFTVNVTHTMKYTPRWTFDFQNGSIAQNYLAEAGINTLEYPKKYPSELDECDDLFVMPHAEPTWETHKNLLSWNVSSKGWIWYGCHAGSVIENLANPLNPAERMNFLSADGLVPDADHDDGTPPYSYRYPTDPEMQFMGIIDGACQNGAEQIYFPKAAGWRPTTKIGVWDPTHPEVPSLSPGEGAIIAYGRAFGDDKRGKVMMQAGHNFDKGTADAVSEIRAFFNFSFLSVIDKCFDPIVSGPASTVAGNTYNYSVQLPNGVNPAGITYYWTSSCGTFVDAFGSSVSFKPTAVSTCTNCVLTVTVRDGCGREYYQKFNVEVCPAPPVAQDITTNMILNSPGTGAQKIGKDFPFAGTDPDGYVVSYSILSLPSSGVLYWENDNNPSNADAAISSLPAGGLILTKQQVKSLKYDPADGFSNNATFTYTVTDNSGLKDATPAIYTIPANPPPVTKTFVCTPASSNTNMFNVCPMEATDEGTIVSYTVVTLPAEAQGTLYLYGTKVEKGQALTPLESTKLTFKPGGGYVGYAEVTYAATDEKNGTDQTPATLTLQLVNQPPAANNISAPTINNPVGISQVTLPALSATDIDGTVASYTITNIPSASQGILYLNSIAVIDNQVISLANADDLKFDAADNFSGVAKFYFTATDNDGLTDNTPATFSIPVKNILPVAKNVDNDEVYTGAGQTLIKKLEGSDGDSTNIIVAYIITRLPDVSEGVLYYSNAGVYAPVVENQVLNSEQKSTLKFDPAGPFIGNATFYYTVKDDEGFTDPTSAKFTIPVKNKKPEAHDVNATTVLDTNVPTTIKPLNAQDEDGSIASYQIITLPAASTGVLTLSGNAVTIGMILTPADAAALQFDPSQGFDRDAKFTFTAVDDMGGVDASPATYTIPISFQDRRIAPKAYEVTNSAINMKAILQKIAALQGTDDDGTVTNFQIKKVPSASQGKLYLQGVPVIEDQLFPADKADQLSFLPSGSFKGTAEFKYKAWDNDSLESGNRDFYIPVENGAPVASNVEISQVKKGSTVTLPGLVADDMDGTVASYKILSLPTLGTLQYDSALNNQYKNVRADSIRNTVMTPAQASRLRIVTGNVEGTSSFTYTATDNLNVISNVATFTIPIGAATLNQKPVVKNITSTPVNLNGGLQVVTGITATDLDGEIEFVTLENFPPSYYGILYYNITGTTYEPVTIGGLEITAEQAALLKFQPSGNYSGNVVITFRARDDDEAVSDFGYLTIPVNNAEPVATNITNASMVNSSGPTLLSSLAATDDGAISTYIITKLPTKEQGQLILDGYAVTLNQVVAAMHANRLEFNPNIAYKGSATFTYTAVDNMGRSDQTPATFTIPVTGEVPVADNKVSQVITNTIGTGAQSIPALTGSDNDGTIANFLIKTLPSGGKLYKNGTLISSVTGAGYTVSPADAWKLTFDPNDNFGGTVSFTYTAKDNDNNVSATAVYEISVNLPPVTSNISMNAMKPSAPTAAIASLTGSDDVSVSFFSITALPTTTEGTLFVNNVAVTSLNQVDTLTNSDVTHLSFKPASTFDGTILTYTATDNMGVIDVTPAVYTIPVFYGAGTILPVELTSFRANRSEENNNLLRWTTSQEVNTDYFVIEYSSDGSHFNTIASVKAKGTSMTATDYSYTHKQVAGSIAYYRLQIVDKDLSAKFSKVVVVKRETSNVMVSNVFPNPIVDRVTISLVSAVEANVTVSLTDINGRTVRSERMQLVRGNNNLTMNNLGKLLTGTHFVTIRNEDININVKVIKK